MDSPVLVSIKNTDSWSIPLTSIEVSESSHLCKNVTERANLDFYENFSSDFHPGSNYFLNEDVDYYNDASMDEAPNKSILITGLESFNQSKYVSTNAESVDSCRHTFYDLDLVTSDNNLSQHEINTVNSISLELLYHHSSKEYETEMVDKDSITSENEDLDFTECVSRIYLLTAFEKWKSNYRSRKAEKHLNEQILSREYFRLKDEYQLRQKNTIASVHFKINIMSESFHKWRMYTISMNVKRRMKDVARVHYTDRIYRHYITFWSNSLKERCIQYHSVKTFIMSNTFRKWRKWTSMSRQWSQQKNYIAIKHYNMSLLNSTYKCWKEKYMILKAQSCYELHQMKWTFRLWSLQLLKRKLQRRLARSHRIMAWQKKYFKKWKSKKEDICCRRYLFAEKLKIFMLRYHWERFKKGVKEEAVMRSNAAFIDKLCKKNLLLHFLSLWKHQFEIECFKSRYIEQDNNFILKIHFEKWIVRRKKIILHRKMESWNIIQGSLHLLQHFSQWQHQKYLREVKNHKYEERLAIAHKNKLSRSFYSWKSKYNDENSVKLFIHNHQRKVLARCFKLWILMKRRAELLKLQELATLSYSFLFWREAVEEKIDLRKRKIDKDNYVLLKCVSHWRDYASISKQQRVTNVTCFARHWLDITQQRNMERRIVQAEKVSNEIIIRVHFAKWHHQFNTALRKRLKMEGLADDHYQARVYSKFYGMWTRQQVVAVLVRNYLMGKERLLLANVLKEWFLVIQQDMLHLLNNFTEKLIISDQSLRSDGNPKWHSPRFSSSLSKSDSVLVNLYKDTLETSLQHSDGLPLQIDTSQRQNRILLKSNEFGSSSSLLLIQKIDHSDKCTSYPSLLFSPSDINDFSSTALNAELLDYNTDNDVDQDQIFEDPTSRSELQLNFSPETTISEDNFMRSNNFSFVSSNIHIPRNNKRFPKWIDIWKKRYVHSRILSKQKRFTHDDVLTPRSNSLLLSLSGSFCHQRDLQLSKEDLENLPKENMDQRKVALLVATLKYWKHLDISAVFYAWLEYTQRKKYLRLMLEYLIEKKKRYVIHTVFLQWNRRLYGSRVMTYFRQNTLTNYYFGQWMNYHLFKQRNFVRSQGAEDKYRKTLIKSYFDKWKRRCHLEFLLSGVNNSMEDDLEMLVEDFTVVRNKHVLENMFLSWKYSTLQMKLSNVHFENNLLIRYLQTWCQYVLVKRNAKLKLKIYQRDHQLKKAFCLWKRRMHHQICVKHITETKEADIKCIILTRWYKWTKLRLLQKVKAKQFLSRVRYQVVNDVFARWKVQHRQKISATDHYSYVICLRVFSAWHGVAVRRRIYENKAKAFRDAALQNLMLKTFSWWQQAHESKQKIRRDGNALSITFKAWKETTLHSKADRQYVDNQFKHVFKSWKERYVSRNEIQFLAKISCRRWKRFMEKSKRNECVIQAYLEQRNLSIKREYFLKWRKNTQMLAISKSRFHGKLLAMTFSAWKRFRERQIVVHQNINQIQRTRENNLVSCCFKIWRENYIRGKALADIKWRLTIIMVKEKAVQWKLKTKEHLFSLKKNGYMLKRYFLLWCRNCQQVNKAIQLDKKKKLTSSFYGWRRFQEHQLTQHKFTNQMQNMHMLNLVSSSFKIWKDRLIQERALAGIRQRLMMISVKEKAVQWKLTTKENIFTHKKIVITLNKYYHIWKISYQQVRKAVKLNEMNKMKICLSYWIISARRHSEVNSKVNLLIRCKQKQMMLKVFLKWREYKTDSIEAQKLEEARCIIADKHFERHLVKTSFYHWNMKAKTDKLKKIRHKILAGEYFRKWRSNIATAKMIVSVFQIKRCEIYWCKWRSIYIQRRVLNVMAKREERRMMSVVFASWSRHAKLKRTLPNQMRLLRTAKWFRKWRNRCNS